MRSTHSFDKDLAAPWCSLLFVPGHRERAVARARCAGAGAICIDLEDGVPASAKADARAEVARLLDAGALTGQAVRINGLGTAEGLADLLMLSQSSHRPGTLVLPKVDGVDAVAIVASVLNDVNTQVLAMIESAQGVANAPAIARHPRSNGLLFGGADLAGEMGIMLNWDAMTLARQAIVLACVGAGRWAYDMPFLGIDDPSALAVEAHRAKALGFVGKAAIHPSQIAGIEAVFRPSQEDIERAHCAIEAFEQSGGGALRFGDEMIDAAIIRQHRTMLQTVAKSSAEREDQNG